MYKSFALQSIDGPYTSQIKTKTNLDKQNKISFRYFCSSLILKILVNSKLMCKKYVLTSTCKTNF